jgi:hypothetical protein
MFSNIRYEKCWHILHVIHKVQTIYLKLCYLLNNQFLINEQTVTQKRLKIVNKSNIEFFFPCNDSSLHITVYIITLKTSNTTFLGKELFKWLFH